MTLYMLWLQAGSITDAHTLSVPLPYFYDLHKHFFSISADCAAVSLECAYTRTWHMAGYCRPDKTCKLMQSRAMPRDMS